MRWSLAWLVLLVLGAGCLGALPSEESSDPDERVEASNDSRENALARWKGYLEDPSISQAPTIRDPAQREQPTAVVAVIDGGINPFHEHFQRAGLVAPGSLPVEARNAETGKPPVYVPAGIEAARNSSQEAWLNDVIEEGTLYRFAGTNLLFYQIPGAQVDPMQPGSSTTIHGTFTAGIAAENAPVVVLVQSYGTYAKAMEWAASQPWIDVISTQLPPSCPAVPGAEHACPHAAMLGPADALFNVSRVVDATRTAWESGKLVVASGGNAPQDATYVERVRGPPWVLAVGGADTYRRGGTVAASQTVDLVSNFTNRGPHASQASAYYNGTGTSGSAPLVAGTIAEALDRTREHVGHEGTLTNGSLVETGNRTITNEEVWAALNATAEYWGASAWDPTADHPEPDPTRSGSAPVNPAAPWLQMGWGYLGPGHADALTKTLLTEEAPDKPDAAEAWMAHRQSLRRAAWG